MSARRSQARLWAPVIRPFAIFSEKMHERATRAARSPPNLSNAARRVRPRDSAEDRAVHQPGGAQAAVNEYAATMMPAAYKPAIGASERSRTRAFSSIFSPP